MTNLIARIESFLNEDRGDGERGALNLDGNGILILIAVILFIVCCVVFLWINIDINEDPK